MIPRHSLRLDVSSTSSRLHCRRWRRAVDLQRSNVRLRAVRQLPFARRGNPNRNNLQGDVLGTAIGILRPALVPQASRHSIDWPDGCRPSPLAPHTTEVSPPSDLGIGSQESHVVQGWAFPHRPAPALPRSDPSPFRRVYLLKEGDTTRHPIPRLRPPEAAIAGVAALRVVDLPGRS